LLYELISAFGKKQVSHMKLSLDKDTEVMMSEVFKRSTEKNEGFFCWSRGCAFFFSLKNPLLQVQHPIQETE